MPKPVPRNHLALVARQRNGGPMKHRNAQRGGAHNTQADLMAEYEDDQYLQMEVLEMQDE